MTRLQTWLTSLKVRSMRFIVAVTVAATGIAFVSSTGMASATEYCAAGITACLNAWGGGPAVNVYNPNTPNDNFILLGGSGMYYNIKYAGSGLYNGACISDALNDPNNARAGLVSCGGSAGTPWGANFSPSNCTSNNYPGFIFKNIHWSNGYLGPQTNTIGAPFYLNKPSGWCFAYF